MMMLKEPQGSLARSDEPLWTSSKKAYHKTVLPVTTSCWGYVRSLGRETRRRHFGVCVVLRDEFAFVIEGSPRQDRTKEVNAPGTPSAALVA